MMDVDIINIKKYSTDTIWYEKTVGDYSLSIHVIKTNNIYNYLNSNVKLKIEQNYYNGSLVVLPFKKYTKLKYEVTDRIKITEPRMTKKLLYYIKCGYSFKIVTNNETIVFKSNDYSKYKYYLKLLKYYIKY